MTKNYLDLIIVLTQKEIKVRYKNYFLGYLWSIANPLAFAFVFYVSFKVVMRVNMEDYPVFLICGLFPWQWFSNSINLSPLMFINNVSIIKKVNFPRELIPLTIVLQDMIHFLFSVPAILIFMFIYHKAPSISWIYGIPLLIVLQTLLVYGVTLMISSLNLFFRDLERLTSILVTFAFYFTPIIYSESMIPEKYRSLVNLNPAAPLMISWRNLLLHGTLAAEPVLVTTCYALVIFVVGKMIYERLSWKFAEVI